MSSLPLERNSSTFRCCLSSICTQTWTFCNSVQCHCTMQSVLSIWKVCAQCVHSVQSVCTICKVCAECNLFDVKVPAIRSKWKQVEQHKGSAFYWQEHLHHHHQICPHTWNHCQFQIIVKCVLLLKIIPKGAFELRHPGEQLGEAQLVSTSSSSSTTSSPSSSSSSSTTSSSSSPSSSLSSSSSSSPCYSW